MAVAVAEEAGRRRAAVVRAHALLQYAAVGCLPEDQAVAYAVRLLRRRTVTTKPAVPARTPAVPAQRGPT